MTQKDAESYSFWRNHLESCHALARPQHHLSLPGCSFPSKAGRELTCFTGVGLNVLYLLLKKTAVKVWGYLLVWQMLLAFPFWRVMSSLFLHYTNHWRGFVFHMTKHLVLIVDFCQVCLLTSPCPFITRSAFIFCHSETLFSFSFPFSVVFLTSCLQHPALPVRVLTEPQERIPLQSSLSRISCRTT